MMKPKAVGGKKIETDEVKYVAHLARIGLTDSEIESFSKQLANILSYIAKLNEVDTKDIQPTSHVLAIKNVFRGDLVKPSLSKEDVLKNAPSRENDFFKVPAVF